MLIIAQINYCHGKFDYPQTAIEQLEPAKEGRERLAEAGFAIFPCVPPSIKIDVDVPISPPAAVTTVTISIVHPTVHKNKHATRQ